MGRFLAFFWLFFGANWSMADGGKDPVRKHALLVGCTRYPALAGNLQLEGPGNDLPLMQKVLQEKLGYPADAITILSETTMGKDHKPTRANIEHQFRRLAREAKDGEFVFILMAGHGSQQPADTSLPDNYEPDGLDEIFFPSDIGPWDGGKVAVKNAITDNELGNWLKAIRAKGASVWIMVDSCHSGTMVRGSDERLRQVQPTALIPKDTFEKARLAAIEHARKHPPPARGKAPDLAAIYASRPDESTYELKLPLGDPDRKFYGILTFAVCKILTQAPLPLTYRELGQRVQAEYIAWGRTHPTPLVEGTDQDREVGGVKEWPGRSRMVLARQGATQWKINAGTLHGVTTGSILAIHDPASKANEVVGHVKVKGCRTLEAEVEPCAFLKFPAPVKLPEGGRGEIVYQDWGDLRLRVAIDASSKKEVSERLQPILKAMSERWKGVGLVLSVADTEKADWLIRSEAGKVYLAPVSGWKMPDGTLTEPLFGPFAFDGSLESTLANRLERIARARNLLRLAGNRVGDILGNSVNIDIELLLLRDENDKEGKPVAWQSGGTSFRDRDIVQFRLHNKGRTEVDVTLLFVDSALGIDAFFPEFGRVTDNRIKPGEKLLTEPFRVRNNGVPGFDHVVTIAVEAKGQPIDFSCLSQPSIERARGNERGTRSMDAPLGALLESAMFGNVRGAREKLDVERHAFRIFSYQVQPPVIPKDQKK